MNEDPGRNGTRHRQLVSFRESSVRTSIQHRGDSTAAGRCVLQERLGKQRITENRQLNFTFVFTEKPCTGTVVNESSIDSGGQGTVE